MNITKLFLDGCKVAQQERKAEEAKRPDSLRGGNTGYTVNGEIHGKCAREAVMRYYGVDKAVSTSRQIMFGAGELMETLLINKIGKAFKGKILTQKEAATSWVTDEGIPVTGSPDIVLANEAGIPQHGIECKMVSSLWTLRDVTPWGMFPGKPKADHLAQAAHYMAKLGEQFNQDFIDWSVVYICPVDYHMHTKDMRTVKVDSEFLIKNDKGDVFKTEAFILVYNLFLDEHRRLYYALDGDDPSPTEITIQGIESYFNLVAGCVKRKELPPRMVNTDCLGEKLKWDRYDKQYNDYHDLHDMYDRGDITFEQFIDIALQR
jgi:hypothetical protein